MPQVSSNKCELETRAVKTAEEIFIVFVAPLLHGVYCMIHLYALSHTIHTDAYCRIH